MATFKRRCSCTGRCSHQPHCDFIVNNFRLKGPIGKWAHLLPWGAKLPTDVAGLRDLESRMRVWAGHGCPAPVPPEHAAIKSEDEKANAFKITMGEVCKSYRLKYVSQMKCRATPGQVNRIEAKFTDKLATWLTDEVAVGEFLTDLVEDAQMREVDNIYSNHDGYLSRLSHLFHWVKLNYAEEIKAAKIEWPTPFRGPDNPKGLHKLSGSTGRHRRLEQWEEDGLVEVFDAMDDGGMMLGRYFVALDCGLRRGEMMQLTLRDLKWNYQNDGPYIHLRWTTTKASKERYVPITSARLLKFLKRRVKELADCDGAGYVFGQFDGTVLTQFRIEWENALIQAKIDKGSWVQQVSSKGKRWGKWIRTVDGDLHWHDLRHEYASRLHENGMPMMKIRDLLGHHSVEVTERYINATDKDTKRQQAQIQKKLGL